MRFWPLLADHAQALGGKLYVMGGGWNVTGPGPSSFALAGVIELEWHEANQPRQLRIELLNEDGRPVEVQTATGQHPVLIEANIEVGRPPGIPQGTAFNAPIAVNVPPIPIPPGGRFVWQFSIDGESRDEWRLPFLTRPAVAPPVQQPPPQVG